MEDKLIEIKDALLTVFGRYLGEDAEQIIQASVWEGDPGGWTNGAIATISLEHGLPEMHEVAFINMWAEVEDYLDGMHVENINGGVSAVYEDR